jgi:putative tryptophan/tyrosine transport system substrate-binding protein
MERRTFIGQIAGGLLAVPLAARAQKPAIPVIGFLYGASSAEWPNRFAAFRKGLAEAGYSEGQNVTIEVHSLEGQYERLPAVAADLARRQVAVIVASGGPQIALAAKAATLTVPIVMTFGGDPVKAGLVASLNRPGGNITGVTLDAVELVAKLLDLFHELLPYATTVALLVNPDSPTAEGYVRATQDVSRALGLQLYVLKTGTERELEAGFEALAKLHAGGLLVGADPFFEIRRERLIALTAAHRIPAFYFGREFVAAGGLASYGTSFNEVAREAGVYAGRILKGAKPADLPILQPTEFEFVINMKTAKALGITIPQSVLLRADEVIE